MKSTASILVLAGSVMGATLALTSSPAFLPATIKSSRLLVRHESLTALTMAKDEGNLYRSDKSKRFADVDDNLVELKRPLGIVLDQDEQGNVYVETLAPRGNAARSGQVKEGDILVMCSATFGDQMWSTRGTGLSRVLNAIKVRAGPTVKLVFENPSQKQRKATKNKKAADVADQARQIAQAKRDALLDEMDQDEKRLKKGKFLGLF